VLLIVILFVVGASYLSRKGSIRFVCLQIRSLFKKKRGQRLLTRPQTPSVVEREPPSLALDGVARPQTPSVVRREFGPFQFGQVSVSFKKKGTSATSLAQYTPHQNHQKKILTNNTSASLSFLPRHAFSTFFCHDSVFPVFVSCVVFGTVHFCRDTILVCFSATVST
jgi:hypothetical protein